MIDVTVDSSGARRYLSDVEQNQIPFAESKAINNVAVAFQGDEFAHLSGVWTVRRPDWLKRSIKITHFAKKSEPWATIAVKPPGATGAQRADILGKFEADTTKQSIMPGGHVAIPISARLKRGNTGVIANRERPSAYHFHQVGNRIVGDRNTFIVASRSKPGTEVILQRTKEGTFALYLLVQRVPIVPSLKWVETAIKTVNARWEPEFYAALERALATAHT